MTEKRAQIRWTPEMDQHVAALLRDGKSGEQIGIAMGISRRMVAGRVYRCKMLADIGFSGRPGPKVEDKPKRKVLPVSPSIFNETPAPVAYSPAYTPERATVGVPMMLLGTCMCKWPVNDAAKGELHLFCAAAADGPYCEEHAQKSIGRGTESERSADRVLAKAA